MKADIDQELAALTAILHALEPLEAGQRRFVLKTAAVRMDISDVFPVASGQGQEHPNEGMPANTGTAVVTTGGGGSQAGQTSKQFLKMKQPKTDVLKIACLAHYLTHAKGQPAHSHAKIP